MLVLLDIVLVNRASSVC